MKPLTIIYRTCDSVNGVNATREFFESKFDCCVKCFDSLIPHIVQANRAGFDVSIVAVCDNCSDELKKHMSMALAQNSIDGEVIDTKVRGNVESFKTSYEIATQKIGYVFFVEDDYFFYNTAEKTGIVDIMEFLRLQNRHCCIKPHHEIADFVRDYKINGKIFDREVLLSNGRYWCQCIKSTMTFLLDDVILKDCKDLFEMTFRLNRLDERYTNAIFERYKLFTPILPIAEHMHTKSGCSPFFEGRRLTFHDKFLWG